VERVATKRKGGNAKGHPRLPRQEGISDTRRRRPKGFKRPWPSWAALSLAYRPIVKKKFRDIDRGSRRKVKTGRGNPEKGRHKLRCLRPIAGLISPSHFDATGGQEGQEYISTTKRREKEKKGIRKRREEMGRLKESKGEKNFRSRSLASISLEKSR